jgi:hypothetical protein
VSLFLNGPIYPSQLSRPADIGAIDLESELEQRWRALRARQARGFDPTGFPEDLDDVEELIESEREKWEHGWPPFEDWPGLAPAGLGSGLDAAEVNRQVLAHILRPIGLHPGGGTSRSSAPGAPPISRPRWRGMPRRRTSFCRHCCEAGKIGGFEWATIHVSVARPPATAADASLVAMEHMLLGDDNHYPGDLNFADYAESLVGKRH